MMATVFMPPPPAAVSHVLAMFNRTALEGFVEVAIGLMDLADGDVDADDQGVEDSFYPHHHGSGPGCTVSDPDGCSAYDDDLRKMIGDGRPGDPDDREEDDPSGVCDEDGINTGSMQFRPSGPACELADPGGGEHENVGALPI